LVGRVFEQKADAGRGGQHTVVLSGSVNSAATSQKEQYYEMLRLIAMCLSPVLFKTRSSGG
jgi:hypothetical protein